MLSMAHHLNRRGWLAGLAGIGLTGCATKAARVVTPTGAVPSVEPIHARMDRMFRITVCSRPFRAAGPRLDVEKVGEKTVVHNYGHGGSGWSLSWGSSAIAVEKAMGTGEKELAVIGCGALGLTSAILAQRAGAKVTIYAKERPPAVRSSRATGSWTPDSRVALASKTDAAFPALWEKMARYSFHTYENYLGLAGNPIEWVDRYRLADMTSQPEPERNDGLDFAHYMDRIRDISPRSEELEPGRHGFGNRMAYKAPSLTFNVASYSHQLMTDFFVEGGKMEMREFRTPNELTSLSQRTIIHATGYGAKALFDDKSIVPVRGQIAWLIPQVEVRYALYYKGVFALSRRDGIVVQSVGNGEMEGYNDASEEPNQAEAAAAIGTIAKLFGS
jgi:D-amino-acid oxidase